MNYDDYFKALTGANLSPHGWQRDLATQEACTNRMIRIPTGFGKTLGVLSTWLWHRVQRQDDRWPRRLVWCLPMRTLVEQTEQEARDVLEALRILWNGSEDHAGKVGVHQLMGGVNSGEWHLYPEHCSVLIGTQDMLLSRALNRGYAAPRARWPMEFGLLNHDALWVMDEVQLMDVGLATSTQLQAFRGEESAKFLRPCATWWMSATLQESWLQKSPDTLALVSTLPAPSRIAANNRKGPLWEDVQKPCAVEIVRDTKALAQLIRDAHVQENFGANGPTLVILNTVDRAVEVFHALSLFKELSNTEIKLVHSRFRSEERKAWRKEFLNKEAGKPGTNRIIVATQVVEAGVNFSASLLITELAPWASLVQRFGRSARWGGKAWVIVADLAAAAALDAKEKAQRKWVADKRSGTKADLETIIANAESKIARPYTLEEIRAAREALSSLTDVAPLQLEAFEAAHPELLPQLYPFEPKHLLLRHELDELFDTTPDLSGADIDISRFIRSGEERDLSVFWAEITKGQEPDPELRPSREALCSLPFLRAREWLCGKETTQSKAPHLKQGMRAWIWDWMDGKWHTAERRDLYPGQTVLVAAECGGYNRETGWNPDSKPALPLVCTASPSPDELADASQDDESLSAYPWKTIATHGRETGALARRIALNLDKELADLLDLGGRWHDAGKVFPAFNGSIKADFPQRPQCHELAKAPAGAWLRGRAFYPMPDGTHRPGFRHELISVLALFSILQRHDPDHPALLGPWRELFRKMDAESSEPVGHGESPSALEQEILKLDGEQFDLLAYLVCAHHGKLRLAWHAAPSEQAANTGKPRLRGVEEGDAVPAVRLCDAGGTPHSLPAFRASIKLAATGLGSEFGPGWTGRVLKLLKRHGPFALAWMEALLRAADQRASREADTFADPLLVPHNLQNGLETSHSELAQTRSRGAAEDSAEPNSAQGSAQHGLRGRTGRPEDAGSRIPAPHHATRYLETTLGTLSYAALAPYLSVRVQRVETDIAKDRFGGHPLDESLILAFHHRICGDLVPRLAGHWRRLDVRVSDHEAPSFTEVPVLMRDYCRDLQARLAAFDSTPNHRLLEFLAFAEGRLLWIHPFEDFNGRVTRVLLSELLQRLGLPAIDPTPEPGRETDDYLAALRAGDRAQWAPLIAIWKSRFEKEGNT